MTPKLPAQPDQIESDTTNDWLDAMLLAASEQVEVADAGFSVALMRRLPNVPTTKPVSLPGWFKALNAGALTLCCAAVAWLLLWIQPDALQALMPGNWATKSISFNTLAQGGSALIFLVGWLCWWSRASLAELVWSSLP